MRKKGQALIITLWILLILTVITVALGQRVSMYLRMGRYQREKLKAIYLTRAGINRAIIEIANDQTLSYDSLTDNWANNEEAFKKIALNDVENEFAAVSYKINDVGEEGVVFGVMDEERKINLNTASLELLVSLLENAGVSQSGDVANNILIWRGETPDDNRVYEGMGFPCKADKFSNTQELILVKGINADDLGRLKHLITVHGDGSVNINTVCAEALIILAKSCCAGNTEAAESVANKIIQLRDSKGYFHAKTDIDIKLTGEEELNLFNRLMEKIVFKSDNFLIEVSGNVGKIKSKVSALYNRKDKKILYWHES